MDISTCQYSLAQKLTEMVEYMEFFQQTYYPSKQERRKFQVVLILNEGIK
jgi:hypothetical protein